MALFQTNPETLMSEHLARIDFIMHTKTVTIEIDRPTSAEAFAAARELIVDTDSVDEVLWETATIDRAAQTITVIGYNVPGFTHEFTIKNISSDIREEGGHQFNDGIALLALVGFGTHLQLSVRLNSLVKEAKLTFDRVAV